MVTIKNVDKPFTEIFSLLRPADINASSIDDLKVIYQHICNVIDIILRGFQDLMDFIIQSSHDQTIASDLWSFFSLITNLVEALNWFRSDVSYSFRQQGILDY